MPSTQLPLRVGCSRRVLAKAVSRSCPPLSSRLAHSWMDGRLPAADTAMRAADAPPPPPPPAAGAGLTTAFFNLQQCRHIIDSVKA